MPRTRMHRHINHSPDDMMAMVADVERYPEFINLITALRITKTLSEGSFEAEAIVAYKMFREAFLSEISIDREVRKIRVAKAKKGGAVKTLENRWTFYELSDGSTLVDFYVDVQLKAFPLEILIRDKFGKASSQIMGAFERRAGQVSQRIGDPDLDLDAEFERLGLTQRIG